MLLANKWKDFELLDAGNGEKLERWGKYILRRPDPQAIWPHSVDSHIWDSADAHFTRDEIGGAHWNKRNNLPQEWTISYGKLKFYIHPTGFKHTGLFPEQAVNWDWMADKIEERRISGNVSVLNLFAYTGGATVACAMAGADVCHVDASKGMVGRAADNLRLSDLGDRKVRFIVDDVFKFVTREIRRGRKYDAIIMDPPSYGRGPGGELWKMENNIFSFVNECTKILSDNPLFFLINSYTTGLSPYVVDNIMRLTVGKLFPNGRISSGETGIPSAKVGIILPCGSYCRWEV